jgi:UDP-2,4-diacetamido-2,4,6-trideoxy-beta-L-altropyranose hydrolase
MTAISQRQHIPRGKTRNALFAIDASAERGGGHFYRCLALSDALAAWGFNARFATLKSSVPVIQKLGRDRTLDLLPLARWDDLPCQIASQTQQKYQTRSDIVVFDHYELDATLEKATAAETGLVGVIDDLPGRSHACDILMDSTPGRLESDYAQALSGRTPDQRPLMLMGPSYALLRDEFLALRQQKPSWARSQVRRVLITLGSTDPTNETSKILGHIQDDNDSSLGIDVVLSAAAPHKDAVAGLCARGGDQMRFHQSPPNMAELMARADIAVGAGGQSALERCCIGLPTVLLQIATNQNQIIQQLTESGAAISVETARDVVPALKALTRDPERIARMSNTASTLVDGLGAKRCALQLVRALAQTQHPDSPALSDLSFRPAMLNDAKILFAWRNDPHTRAASVDTAQVEWSGHYAWLERSVHSDTRRLVVVERQGLPVGTLRADLIGSEEQTQSWEISWTIAPEARGDGLAKRIVPLWARMQGGHVLARIKSDNVASQKVAAMAGLSHAGHANGLQIWNEPDSQ